MFTVTEANWYRTVHAYANESPVPPEEVDYVHVASLWPCVHSVLTFEQYPAIIWEKVSWYRLTARL